VYKSDPNGSISHSQEDRADFAVVLSVVDPFYAGRVTKRLGRKREAHAMFAEIMQGFYVIPFELNLRLLISRSLSKDKRIRGVELTGSRPRPAARQCVGR